MKKNSGEKPCLPAGRGLNLFVEWMRLGIDDSKRLRLKERERVAKWIKENCLAWDITGIGVGRNPRYKGYGTKLQQRAILRYGLTMYHRRSFVQTWLEKKAELGEA